MMTPQEKYDMQEPLNEDTHKYNRYCQCRKCADYGEELAEERER